MATSSRDHVAVPYHNLFERLATRGIPCAAFKSLEKFAESLAGEDDDIDLFLRAADVARAHQALRGAGFVRDAGSASQLGREILVYRSVDPVSGRPLMIHLYLRLRFGAKRRKQYAYPHQQEALDHVVYERGAPRVSLAHEFVLRLLMDVTKRLEDDPHLVHLAGGFDGSEPVLARDLPQLLGMGAQEALSIIVDHGPGALASQRPELIQRLREAGGNHGGIVASAASRFLQKGRGARSRLARLPYRNKLGSGRSITLLGVDGAGKTTTAQAISEVLGPMAPVRCIYLGRNRWDWRLNRWLRAREGERSRLGDAAWTITSSTELIMRHRSGQRFKRRGGWVVYDRHFVDDWLRVLDNGPATSLGGRLRRRFLARLARARVDHRILLDLPLELAASRDGSKTRAELEGRRRRYDQLPDVQRVSITEGDRPRDVAARVVHECLSDQEAADGA